MARGDATGQTRVSSRSSLFSAERKQSRRLSCDRPPPAPAASRRPVSDDLAAFGGHLQRAQTHPVPAPGSGGGRGLPGVRLCSPSRDKCIYYVNVDP